MENENLLLGIDLFEEYAHLCFFGQLSGFIQSESLSILFNEQHLALTMFLEEVMKQVELLFSKKRLIKIAVVLDGDMQEEKKRLQETLFRMGFSYEQFYILSKMESFLYFTVSQSNQLWRNDVVLFDFTKKGLLFYCLDFDRKRSPILIATDCVDLKNVLNLSHLQLEEGEHLKNLLAEIASPLLAKRPVSSIYVTGIGFEKNWADDVMKTWCVGRRVFVGQNLYAKGACYAAKIFEEEAETKYFLLQENSIRCSLFFSVFHNTMNEMIPFIEMGTHFKEAKAEVEVILDQTDELQFLVKDGVRQDTIQLLMRLDNQIQARDKVLHLSVKAYFLDRETLVLRIKDLGFGEFFGSTYQIWEQVVKI